jgi:hypothetical protein
VARTTKRYTPAQFAAVLVDISDKLGHIKPVMAKQAKRYQLAMRRNISQQRNADGSPMEPLTGLTLQGKVGGRERRTYGDRALQATGQMRRAFKAFPDDRGWIAYVTDDFKRKVSFWQGNVPSGRPMRIKPARDPSGRSMARAMARKGMPVSPATAAAGFFRPARLPFALKATQVRRSVKELNKFVLKPLFG